MSRTRCFALLGLCLLATCTRRVKNACLAHTDCPSGMCLDYACQSQGTFCETAQGCPSERPICSAAWGLCHACQQHSDCQLSYPQTPYCDTTEGSCGSCRDHADCAAPQAPVCVAAACGPCSSHEQCAERDEQTPGCAPDGGCQECLEHQHCKSGVCDQEAFACIDSELIVYVDAASTADGETCGSKQLPCQRLEHALLHATDDRPFIHLAEGSHRTLGALTLSADSAEGMRHLVGYRATLSPLYSLAVEPPGTVLLDNIHLDAFDNAVFCLGQSTTEPATLQLQGVTMEAEDARGIDATNCDLLVHKSTIKNTASSAIEATGGRVTILDSHFASNNGALYATDITLRVERTLFWENTGGISINGLFDVANNYFVRNEQTDQAAAFTVRGNGEGNGQGPGARFVLNTVVGHRLASSSASPFAFSCIGGAGATLSSNIFWDNVDERQAPSHYATDCGDASYSIIEGGSNGTGNLNATPRFRAPTNNDFRLSDDSPAIDKGDPALIDFATIDFDGTPRPSREGLDIGADEVP